jgi:hypothetical protein
MSRTRPSSATRLGRQPSCRSPLSDEGARSKGPFVKLDAASGTAATLVVTSKNIKNGTIQTVDLSAKAKLALRGNRGPRGAAGSVGATGAQGATGSSGRDGSSGRTEGAGTAGVAGTERAARTEGRPGS